MNAKKFASVCALSPLERYGYFVRKVCDTQVVWGLRREGWATTSVNGEVAIPFWPEAEFADACATGAWDGYKSTPVALDDFLDTWLTGMSGDNPSVHIFPTPDAKANVVSAPVLGEHLRAESSQYE